MTLDFWSNKSIKKPIILSLKIAYSIRDLIWDVN